MNLTSEVVYSSALSCPANRWRKSKRKCSG